MANTMLVYISAKEERPTSSRVTYQGERHGARGVSVMRSAVLVQSLRLAGANISVPSHGTDGQGHTAGEDPHHVSPKAVGRPIPCNTRWIKIGHHVLEFATTYHRETLSLAVSVRDTRGPPWSTPMRTCFSPEGDWPRSSRASRNIPSSSW